MDRFLFSCTNKIVRLVGSLFFTSFFFVVNVHSADFEPVLVSDLRSGLGSSSPKNLTKVGDQLFFSVFGALWRSDGTSEGTQRVKRVPPSNLTELNGKVLFTSIPDLWVSDGTESGTVEIATDFLRSPRSLLQLGDKVVFMVDDVFGSSTLQIWSSDGTSDGTNLVIELTNVLSLQGFGQIYSLFKSGDLVYFRLNNALNGEELWVTDGTNVGTKLVSDINSGIDSSNPGELTDADGVLYFSANDGSNGRQLWKTDGTAANTVIVRDLSSNGGNQPENLFADGSTVYFSAVDNDGFNREPWVTDGSSAGTFLLKDIATIPFDLISSFPKNFQSIGGSVFFSTNQGDYKTDGTSLGTVEFDLPLSPSAGSDVVEFDGDSYFSTNTELQGDEPAFTDGTVVGTEILLDINAGNADSTPDEFTVVGDILFFSANDGVAGRELWAFQKLNKVNNVEQFSAGDSSVSFDVEVNTDFNFINYYAICHSVDSDTAPTAEDIKAGRIDATIQALSSTALLNFDTSSVDRAQLTCGSLPNAATDYNVFVVFENAENTNEFSEVYSNSSLGLRTAPQVSSLEVDSVTKFRANFNTQISLASQTNGLRVYYVCDESAVAPTPEEIIAGEISDGVQAQYSSSINISSTLIDDATSVNRGVSCFSLDPGTKYYFYATVDDLGLIGNSFGESPASLSFATQGEIGNSSLTSVTESSISFGLSQFVTTFANINLYVVCHDVALTDPPLADDIKQGRVDSVTQATQGVTKLSVDPSLLQSLVCENLSASSAHEIYAVFENSDEPGVFSTVRQVHSGHWRTAPELVSIVSNQTNLSSIDITVSLNHLAQVRGSRIYWVCDDSALIPTAENIIDGRISNNIFADRRGVQTVVNPISVDTQITITCNNLNSGTDYMFYAIAEERAFQYSLIPSFQVQPISTSIPTISKIDSIRQTGMTESKIEFDIDSISTSFDNVNIYVVCGEDGGLTTPSAQDIKAGRIAAQELATSSGRLMNVASTESSFSLSCESGTMAPATLYDVYSVFENADNPGEFSEIFQDAATEWRTVPVITELIAEIIENESISVLAKVRSAASVTDVRLHMICDKTTLIPSSENIIVGLIDENTVASTVEKIDLNAFTNSQAEQQHAFSCVPSEPEETYNVFIVAEDLAFQGPSFQTIPSSSMGELDLDELCLPIRVGSNNSVVLICL